MSSQLDAKEEPAKAALLYRIWLLMRIPSQQPDQQRISDVSNHDDRRQHSKQAAAYQGEGVSVKVKCSLLDLGASMRNTSEDVQD